MIECNEEQVSRLADKEKAILYLYTPFCGTCQLAKKMMTVVEAMLPALEINMANLNYLPKQASDWEIESVPCLLVFENGRVVSKTYAFHSVEHLYHILKKHAA